MRLSRVVPVVLLGLTVSGGLAGCAPAVVSSAAPAAARSAEELQVQMQPLTADQLALILGVNAWTAKYSGGPIECWLEIEEEGQATLPKRIPEKGHLNTGLDHPPSEGTLGLWWRRREDGSGILSINAVNGTYGYALDRNAFTFAWPEFGAQTTTIGKGGPVPAKPGKEYVLVDYDAIETTPKGEKKAPRRVHLKLVGRFPSPKGTKN